MDIQFTQGNDPAFAEALTKSNMASYYRAREITWDHDQFLRSWEEFDNYDVIVHRHRVGVIRFSYSADTTFLRDFQLLPEAQGKGTGSQCLELAMKHACDRGSSKIVLRVFSENPAIKLYESKDFIRTSEVKGLLEMECALPACGFARKLA